MFRKPKRKASTRGDRASTTTMEEGEEGAAGSAAASAEDGEEAPAPEGGEWEGSRGAGREGGDEDEDEGGPSSDLFRSKKKPKPPVPGSGGLASSAPSRAAPSSGKAAGEHRDLMHSYAAASGAGGGGSGAGRPTHAELATRAAEHHAVAAAPGSASSSSLAEGGAVGKGPDGIFRNAARNKFAAGPIRAQTNVRVTARFDYQPDVCKDYKDTGFCGFGDTCIYLHDRGDTLSGWQIERAWEEDQKKKRRALEEEQMRAFAGGAEGAGADGGGGPSALVAADDGLPFACYLCRGAFKDPVVTNCQHYFCQSCVLEHVRSISDKCPVCGRDTHSVFNQPTKLLAKMRRVARSAPASAGGGAAKSPWQAYYDAMVAPKSTADEWE